MKSIIKVHFYKYRSEYTLRCYWAWVSNVSNLDEVNQKHTVFWTNVIDAAMSDVAKNFILLLEVKNES